MSNEKIDAQKIQDEISAWATSDKGKREIQESLKKIENVTEKLNRARQVSLEMLHKPFTV